MCCIVLSCQPSTQCLRVSASVGLSTMVTTAGHVEHQPAAGVVVECVLLPEAARLCGLVLVCFSTKRTSGMPGCMDVGTPWSASPCVVAQFVLARRVAKGCSRLRIKTQPFACLLHPSCMADCAQDDGVSTNLGASRAMCLHDVASKCCTARFHAATITSDCCRWLFPAVVCVHITSYCWCLVCGHDL